MRRGIGLRGYGGTDPLNEFKREAFKLYEELRGFISKQVANNIFRVQVQQVPQQRRPSRCQSRRSSAARPARAAVATAQQADQITPVEGGHVHSDGTFHADAPPANGNGQAARVGSSGREHRRQSRPRSRRRHGAASSTSTATTRRQAMPRPERQLPRPSRRR